MARRYLFWNLKLELKRHENRFWMWKVAVEGGEGGLWRWVKSSSSSSEDDSLLCIAAESLAPATGE